MINYLTMPNVIFSHFKEASMVASPSLRVEVFGSVGDVKLGVFARLSAPLVLWPFFKTVLHASLFST